MLDTQAEAYAYAKTKGPSLEETINRVLNNRGPSTPEEIVEWANVWNVPVTLFGVRPAVTKMVQQGKLLHWGKKKNRNGRSSTVVRMRGPWDA